MKTLAVLAVLFTGTLGFLLGQKFPNVPGATLRVTPDPTPAVTPSDEVEEAFAGKIELVAAGSDFRVYRITHPKLIVPLLLTRDARGNVQPLR